jgi:hypothetical protein
LDRSTCYQIIYLYIKLNMFPNVEQGDILLTKIVLTLDGHFNICESIVDSDITNRYSLCSKESSLSSNLWDPKDRLRALGKSFFFIIFIFSPIPCQFCLPNIWFLKCISVNLMPRKSKKGGLKLNLLILILSCGSHFSL